MTKKLSGLFGKEYQNVGDLQPYNLLGLPQIKIKNEFL